MDCKQRTIDELFQPLAVCLQRESLTRDENIFMLQSSKTNSNTKNFDQSKLSAAHDNKTIDVSNAPLDKDNRQESIDDNYCNSNECYENPDHELSNKIENDNSKNHYKISKNHQNNTNNFNNSRAIQYDVSRNDINNENVLKPSSTKGLYVVGDSIVKHVNGYDISRKTENSKVFVRSSHGATVRCMTHHVGHIVFHIDTNVPSNKTPETIAKSTLGLAISSKSSTCDVWILNILIRKDNYQQKAQEVNAYHKLLCKEFNIHLLIMKKV